MEFILICLLVALLGGILGFVYGKRRRNQPKKVSAAARWCIGILLGLLLSRTLDWNWGICIALGLLMSEAVGIGIPRQTKDE